MTLLTVSLGNLGTSSMASLVWSAQQHDRMADVLSSLCKIAISQAYVLRPASIIIKGARGGYLVSEAHS
jgi:hypothetical protein